MNHCKQCGNNIPPDVQDCEQAGFGEGCGKTLSNMTNKERSVEELAKQIAMFPDDDILPEDMMIDYDRIKVGDIHKIITQTLQSERQKREEVVKAERERIKEWIEDKPWCKLWELDEFTDKNALFLDADVHQLIKALTQPNNK